MHAPSHLSNLCFQICIMRELSVHSVTELLLKVCFLSPHILLSEGKKTGWGERGWGIHMTLELVELLGHSLLGGTALAAAGYFPIRWGLGVLKQWGALGHVQLEQEWFKTALHIVRDLCSFDHLYLLVYILSYFKKVSTQYIWIIWSYGPSRCYTGHVYCLL